jgi:hypothetical protein
VTRFLSAQDFTSKDLWRQVKPEIPLIDSSVFRKAAVEINEKQEELF